MDDEILGKPADSPDARRMLRLLSARAHDVWTGVALVETTDNGARELARACRTAVTFRELTEREIAAYVASGEPLDKAGAYAIQGGAAAFVTHIYGDFTNVVGLPLSTVEEMFRERPARL